MPDDVKTKLDTPVEAMRKDIDAVLKDTEDMAQPELESEKIHGDKLEDALPPGKGKL